MSREISIDRRAIERGDALARAENRAADRLIRPCRRGQEIEHEVVGRVFDGADFLHDDVFFSRELLGIELAVGDDVGEHVHREVDVLAQHMGEITGLFGACFRVEIAADVLDRLGDLARVASARALERHVLEQVRQTVLLQGLVSRSRADEDAERGRAQVRARIGDDAKSRRQARRSRAQAARPRVGADETGDGGRLVRQ